MKKRYTLKNTIAVVFVGVIAIVGCILCLRRQEFTPERATKVFKKYETDLTTIAEYVSGETRWSRYYNKDRTTESYLNADFLPEQVVKSMTVFFEKIAKAVSPSIERIAGESKSSPNGSNHMEEGAIFFVYSSYQGKDAEGSQVLVHQYFIYLVSDNPDCYLEEVGGTSRRGNNSITQIADNWYFVTQLG